MRDREVGRWEGVIAIDGPAASGKSTLARRLAGELGLAHLDTGAFYRAAALAVLRAGSDCRKEAAAVEVVRRVSISQDAGRTRLDGEDVESRIRSQEVTEAASRVAALPGVRRVLVESQREWVNRRGGSAVVEGRDIGTVVFPEAAVKIYLTAAPAERTRRRAAEMGGPVRQGQVAESIARRDRNDSNRAASPLRRASGALEIDTTTLGSEEAAAVVLELIRCEGDPSMKLVPPFGGTDPGGEQRR